MSVFDAGFASPAPRYLAVLTLVVTLLGAMVGIAVATYRTGMPTGDPAAAGLPDPVEHAGAGDDLDVERLDLPAPAPTPEVVEEPATPPEPAAAEPAPPPPSYDVVAVQRRLTDLRYYVGPLDGAEGPAMRSAVMAFQKVNGLTVDGAVGATTLAALDTPAQPVLRQGPADRIEIDLNIQVLHLITGGTLERTMPVSSGNGAAYTTSGGGRANSLTPVGHFTVERRIRGVRKAPLGTLYDPLYFYRGWAIHGSNSVPAHPASHGCVRVTRADAVWLFDRAPTGMSVSLYGGQHTFPAGSAAPGTDNPAGDVAPVPAPAPPPPPPPPPTEPSPAPSAPPPPPAPEPQPEGGGLLPSLQERDPEPDAAGPPP
ncbi:MAG: L,D-transpeptidase family protein [Egibacteraceae bacterium]